MKIEISTAFTEDILRLCCLELDYQVYETSDPKGYSFEIGTEIALLELIGEGQLANLYREAYRDRLEEFAD